MRTSPGAVGGEGGDASGGTRRSLFAGSGGNSPSMADKKLTDHSGEMEHDLARLEDHITDAERQLEARRKEADPASEVAGSWEGEQDRGGGDDPVGAERDAGQGAPGGSQDGVPEDDGRAPEEVANPT